MNTKHSKNLIFLWCVPRSVSTAYEKMMACSNKFIVFGEPFIDIFKNSLLSESHFRHSCTEFENQCQKLLEQSHSQPVFVKDMAYHAEPFLSDELIRSATHTFLIRDPQRSIPSLYKMRPGYTEDQPGFEGQYKLLNRIEQVTNKRPLVIDAEALTSNASEVIANYFSYIGHDLPRDILSWPIGSRDDWSGRESWHLDAINSQGFYNKSKVINLSGLPTKVLESIERNRFFYNQMRKLVS